MATVEAPAPCAPGEEYTGQSFDLQSYLARSRQIDLSGIEWKEAGRYPLSEGEARCLTYMMDIESHTLCYVRDVLNAGAGADTEIADFLGCWLYEESFHGRAIERFLRAAGVQRGPNVCGRHRFHLGERLEKWGTWLVSRLWPRHFVTLYMAWGAIQEHSTLFGYTNLARQTRNPVLAELLRRIARDESRHFGFYYYKAYQGLKDSPFARAFTSFFLKRFWTPVGEGVKPRSEADFLIVNIFDGAEGREATSRIDRTMARLPGLSWFDLMTRRAETAFRRRDLSLIPARAAA